MKQPSPKLKPSPLKGARRRVLEFALAHPGGATVEDFIKALPEYAPATVRDAVRYRRSTNELTVDVVGGLVIIFPAEWAAL